MADTGTHGSVAIQLLVAKSYDNHIMMEVVKEAIKFY